MKKPRLHLVGLPFSCTDHSVTVCAFTTKAEKFLKMMTGWDIFLYWGDKNDCPCTELITLHTEEDRVRWYGENYQDPNRMPIVCGDWGWDSDPWVHFNEGAIREIKQRFEPGDLILITGGYASHKVAEAFPGEIVCEWAVGYEGWFSSYCCFESYAWKSNRYGSSGVNDGRFFDAVIPNYFDPVEFPDQLHQKEDYLVYFGRMIYRKGITVAAEIAKRAEMPIKFAGSGVASFKNGIIETEDGNKLDGDVEYVGTVNAKERFELVSKAKASLCPTLYIEPFGGVAVEAQLAGTQPITTDFGAFPETVDRAFRFNTIREAVECVHKPKPAPKYLRQNALDRFSLEAVKPMFEEWFYRLSTLHGEGFYA